MCIHNHYSNVSYVRIIEVYKVSIPWDRLNEFWTAKYDSCNIENPLQTCNTTYNFKQKILRKLS